jgi:hypothetical protein
MHARLSHANSQLITRDQLLTIAPPPSTATWRPIAHADLITALDRQLQVRGIMIQAETFAIQREGARLFAVLDLSIERSGEFCASLGLRTANDRSLALEIAVGVKVFVCDNLAFSGDLIALRRKHTARFDLNADISRAVDRYQAHLLTLREQITTSQQTPLSDLEAKALIVDAFRQEILPIRFFKPVTEIYYRPAPDMTDVLPRTRWGLHNAFTRCVRHMAPAPAFEATTALGQFFGLHTINS